MSEETGESFETLVRLRLITHNARLVDARKERSLTAQDMAQAAGIPKYRLRHIENLRWIPTEDEMIKMACILEKPIDYLFPETLLDAVKAGVFGQRQKELGEPEVISLTEAQRLRLSYGDEELLDEVDRRLLPERIAETLQTLMPREQNVLRLRFGLDDGHARTLEEVGREFGATGERIRQIEVKALRKLRHPSRSKKLKDFLT